MFIFSVSLFLIYPLQAYLTHAIFYNSSAKSILTVFSLVYAIHFTRLVSKSGVFLVDELALLLSTRWIYNMFIAGSIICFGKDARILSYC